MSRLQWKRLSLGSLVDGNLVLVGEEGVDLCVDVVREVVLHLRGASGCGACVFSCEVELVLLCFRA